MLHLYNKYINCPPACPVSPQNRGEDIITVILFYACRELQAFQKFPFFMENFKNIVKIHKL